MNFLIQHSKRLYRQLSHTLLLLTASIQCAAQTNPTLPKIGPGAGVDASTDPVSIPILIFKVVGGVAIWLAVAWFGLQMFWAVIKAANEARGGESSWMEAGKSMLGNVMIFVFFLAMALWFSAAFLA